MSKRHRKNRQRERSGVNAARTFFEKEGCIFQEVSLENDYGKDAYLDIGDDQTASSTCAALQIKSGASYQSTNGYKIPLDANDFDYWRSSTVPIIGIVHDPDDNGLRWVNITEFLDRLSGPKPSHIPINASSRLTPATLRGEFTRSITTTVVGFRRHPLVQLCGGTQEQQFHAVSDCFALGRKDSRLLIGLRYLLLQLSDAVLLHGIRALAHVTPHPDIFWTTSNWIPENRCNEVRPHLRWSVSEMVSLLSRVPNETWERGQSGQDLFMLIIEDPDLMSKLEDAAHVLLKTDDQVAIHAVYLCVALAKTEGQSCLERLIADMPSIKDDEIIISMADTLRMHGYVGLW